MNAFDTQGDQLVPEEGPEGLKRHFLSDFSAGFVVFLVALPMAMAIAGASGVPVMAAFVASIVGALIMPWLGGGFLTIKGAPAGLSAVALACVVTFSQEGNLMAGYLALLAVVVVSGGFQILLGLLRAGALGDFFPAAAIQGLLAALGVRVVVQQLPVALGEGTGTGDLLTTLQSLPGLINNVEPNVLLISLVSLVLLVIFDQIKSRILQKIPGALVVVLVAIPMAILMGVGHPPYTVDIPENLGWHFLMPNFSILKSFSGWEYVLLFTFIGSLESLLSAKAIDAVDPYHRRSNLSRDLLAIGVGNVISGMLGGLSMISASKRSLINVNNGAKTRWSNFYHGIFLIVGIAVAGPWLGKVPSAALAALLIYAGYRLITPRVFFRTWKVGPEQLFVFVGTLVAILNLGIIFGLLVGLALEIIVHLFFGVKLSSIFRSDLEVVEHDAENIEVKTQDAALFTHGYALSRTVAALPAGANVTFNFERSRVVDHSFMETLSHLEYRIRASGGQLALDGLDYHAHLSDHPLAARRLVSLEDEESPRRTALSELAEREGFQFDPRRMTNMSKYEQLAYARHRSLAYEQNVIRLTHNDCEIQSVDLQVEQGAGVTYKAFAMTAVWVRLTGLQVPAFSLERESFIDSIIDRGEEKDIDFERFPNFSYYYLLRGPDQAAIRAFFKERVILFFERNRGYNVEVRGDVMFLYRRPNLLDEAETLEQIDHARRLLDAFRAPEYHFTTIPKID